MNGLEAFCGLKESIEYKGGDFYCANEQRLNTIEKELKAFETIKRFVKDLKTNTSMDIICVQNPVNPSVFIACEDIEYYLICETQKELDLLEEVLE